ncbi:SAF domain-containing protein [Streptomyces sp. SID13031]|uniref:SAF domain-containing protein n=1 Tax=Streptomyces sp. SID13031 TaxID=2706046 RepID=UPI0013CBFEAF|nr:SAF domain-containing protein [Streptomyces sp. SID13031]NEA31512.1 flagellar biosynthesis protein FlgA [Streptomyces sp. SID13031]
MSTIGTETADSQRQRANRAGGAGRKPGGRLPAASKRRRPAIAALAALLIVGGALIAGVLAVRMDERVAVIQVKQNINVGSVITEELLAQTRVSGDALNTIPADQARLLIGKKYAAVNLVKGQLLEASLLTDEAPISKDKAAVGIVLVDGRTPALGLRGGDVVELVRIGQGNVPPVLIGDAVVLKPPVAADKGSSLGEKSSSSALVATVLVDREDVMAVTDASGNNRIAVALLSRGSSLGQK